MEHPHKREFKAMLIECLHDPEFADTVAELLVEHLKDDHNLAVGMAQSPAMHGSLREHFVHHDHHKSMYGGK